MAIAVAATRQALADAYKTAAGNYIGVATGNPGTSSTPANEATGGGYARVATTWSSGSTGTATGTAVTISVAAGTYTHIFTATGAATNTMTDVADTTDVVMSTAGTLVVTPTFTQT